MQCPRCGADNSPQADRCALCEYPFEDAGVIEGGAQSEADTPAGPGTPPPAVHAQAPPPAGTPGQPPMPAQPPLVTPRVYPPGYQAPPPKVMSTGMKALIAGGILLGIAILVAVFALVFFKSTPSIKVPTPPGWEKADKETTEEYEKALSQGSEEIVIDYLFTDGTLNNSVTVAHGRAYIMDSPDSESFEDVEAFFMEHQEEIENEILLPSREAGITVNATDYRVEEMASGIPALFMSIALSGQGITARSDLIFFFKDDTMFFAVASTVGTGGNQEVIDFLKENISFE